MEAGLLVDFGSLKGKIAVYGGSRQQEEYRRRWAKRSEGRIYLPNCPSPTKAAHLIHRYDVWSGSDEDERHLRTMSRRLGSFLGKTKQNPCTEKVVNCIDYLNGDSIAICR